MGKTALELRQDEWRFYHPVEAINNREAKEKVNLQRRRRQAWYLARKAAKLLQDGYGAKRVVVFGSLAHRMWFTPWSDIDLAAWDIAPNRFYEAVDAVVGLSANFRINLVDPESCREGLRATIEREGVAL